jgi:hypothetical protein
MLNLRSVTPRFPRRGDTASMTCVRIETMNFSDFFQQPGGLELSLFSARVNG